MFSLIKGARRPIFGDAYIQIPVKAGQLTHRDSVKYLGVILHRSPTWSSHVNHIVGKIRRLYVLCLKLHRLSTPLIKRFYLFSPLPFRISRYFSWSLIKRHQIHFQIPQVPFLLSWLTQTSVRWVYHLPTYWSLSKAFYKNIHDSLSPCTRTPSEMHFFLCQPFQL